MTSDGAAVATSGGRRTGGETLGRGMGELQGKSVAVLCVCCAVCLSPVICSRTLLSMLFPCFILSCLSVCLFKVRIALQSLLVFFVLCLFSAPLSIVFPPSIPSTDSNPGPSHPSCPSRPSTPPSHLAAASSQVRTTGEGGAAASYLPPLSISPCVCICDLPRGEGKK